MIPLNTVSIILIELVLILLVLRINSSRSSLTDIIIWGKRYRRRARLLEGEALDVVVTDTGNVALKVSAKGVRDFVGLILSKNQIQHYLKAFRESEHEKIPVILRQYKFGKESYYLLAPENLEKEKKADDIQIETEASQKAACRTARAFAWVLYLFAPILCIVSSSISLMMVAIATLLLLLNVPFANQNGWKDCCESIKRPKSELEKHMAESSDNPASAASLYIEAIQEKYGAGEEQEEPAEEQTPEPEKSEPPQKPTASDETKTQPPSQEISDSSPDMTPPPEDVPESDDSQVAVYSPSDVVVLDAELKQVYPEGPTNATEQTSDLPDSAFEMDSLGDDAFEDDQRGSVFEEPSGSVFDDDTEFDPTGKDPEQDYDSSYYDSEMDKEYSESDSEPVSEPSQSNASQTRDSVPALNPSNATPADETETAKEPAKKNSRSRKSSKSGSGKAKKETDTTAEQAPAGDKGIASGTGKKNTNRTRSTKAKTATASKIADKAENESDDSRGRGKSSDGTKQGPFSRSFQNSKTSSGKKGNSVSCGQISFEEVITRK